MSAPTRGGRRPRAGRPRSYVEQLRRSDGDNRSDGIRRPIEEARTPSGDFWSAMPARALPNAAPGTEAAME